MISVNTFFKKWIYGAVLITMVLVLINCGHKRNPLPPIVKNAKPPAAPALFQRGDAIVITIANPFINRAKTDKWSISVYRLRKVDFKKDEEKALNPTKGIETGDSSKPELVILKKDKKTGRFLAKAGKIKIDEFEKAAKKIFELSSEDSSGRSTGPQFIYEDKISRLSGDLFPRSYYYAVHTEDSEDQVEGYSVIKSIVPLAIASAPLLKKYKTDEKNITLEFELPYKSAEAGDETYFTGVALYKGDCKKKGFVEISKNRLKLAPLDWNLKNVMKIMKVSGSDQQKDYTRIVFQGDEKQALSQKVFSQIDYKKMKDTTFILSLESKTDIETTMHIQIDFGSESQKKIFEAESNQEFGKHSYEFQLDEKAKQMDISLSLKEYRQPVSMDLLKISLIKKQSDKVEVVELIKNPGFEEYPECKFEDRSFKFDIKYCYHLTTYLEYDGNYYESEPGEALEVIVEDKFPPKAPTGFYKLARLNSVTLVWTANREKDIQGYYVYRKKEGDKDFTKLSEKPIRDTQFADSPDELNKKYYYYIAAVDKSKNKNESAQSIILEFTPVEDLSFEEK